MMILSGTAPAHICVLLSAAHKGTVEMINSRGIYLELADRRILLCSAEFGTVPNGASLENWALLPPLLQQGQPVRSGGGLLRFPFGKLRLQLEAVPEDAACCLPPQQGLQQALAQLLQLPEKGLAPLAHPLFDQPLADMDLRCETALPHVEGLLAAIAAEDPAATGLHAKNLLGFGLGLTPSGDDILAGLMYGLRHSSLRDAAGTRALTECIQLFARERTNAVSADYLLALCHDAAFTRLAEAWRDPAACAEKLLAVGSSSGSEMLLGLLLAARLLGQL